MESEATVRAACGGSRWINGMAEEKDPRWRIWLRVEVPGGRSKLRWPEIWVIGTGEACYKSLNG